MVAGPLVETKLFLPQPRGDAVTRPRLTELLDRGRPARLTLVSAPAGFGKTTLLARGLAAAQGQRSVAWLSLEEADSQPARFWTYLVTAVQRAVPGVGDGALALLATRQPALDTVLATLVNELSAAPTELDLVLDDYHLVDEPGPTTGRGLPARAPAAPCAPGHQHPGRPCAAAGQAACPGRTGRDSRRRPALHPGRGRGLPQRRRRARASPPADIAALETRTEGWIAALQLAALSLRGRADAGRVHRCVRRRRPLHRGLPGRGGAQPTADAGARLPARRPPSSTG